MLGTRARTSISEFSVYPSTPNNGPPSPVTSDSCFIGPVQEASQPTKLACALYELAGVRRGSEVQKYQLRFSHGARRRHKARRNGYGSGEAYVTPNASM